MGIIHPIDFHHYIPPQYLCNFVENKDTPWLIKIITKY